MSNYKPRAARISRHARIRARVSGSGEKPRLSVFRSLKNIYAQVIDDARGCTLVSASNISAEVKTKTDGKNKTAEAQLVGKLLAERALGQGITQVVFDRGGYKYHGRVKALAEAAREGGLKF